MENHSENVMYSHYLQEIPLEIRYFERGLSKSLKKLPSFFISNPVPFKWQSSWKQKGLGT